MPHSVRPRLLAPGSTSMYAVGTAPTPRKIQAGPPGLTDNTHMAKMGGRIDLPDADDDAIWLKPHMKRLREAVETQAPLTPWFPLTEPNAPIELFEGKVSIEASGSRFPAFGRVRLEWLPTPQLRVSYHCTEPNAQIATFSAHAAGDDWTATAEIDAVPRPPQGTWSPDIDAPVQAEDERYAHTVQVLPAGDGTLVEVSFLVASLTPVMAAHHLTAGRASWTGRTVLHGGGWLIVLDAPSSRREVRDSLQRHGGYAATHIGLLVREDGADFTPDEAIEVMNALRYTLSFAVGRWVAPILPVGFDPAGEAVWTVWQRGELVHPYHRGGHELADIVSPAHIPDLFTAFTEVWADDFRRDVLCRAVNYYIEACDPNPCELAVSAAQSALEMLAYLMLVEEGTMSKTKFKDAGSAGRKRSLLDSCSIEAAYPANLTLLEKTGTDLQYGDAVKLLTEMRNTVIHPSKENESFSVEVWSEAWLLSLRHLLLAILSYVRYNGTYRDPVAEDKYVGVVAPVPWADKEQPA